MSVQTVALAESTGRRAETGAGARAIARAGKQYKQLSGTSVLAGGLDLQRELMLVGRRWSEQKVGPEAQGFKCCLRRSRKVGGSAVEAITKAPRRLALFSSLLLSTATQTALWPGPAIFLAITPVLSRPNSEDEIAAISRQLAVTDWPEDSVLPFSRRLSANKGLSLHVVVVCIDAFQGVYQTSHAPD